MVSMLYMEFIMLYKLTIIELLSWLPFPRQKRVIARCQIGLAASEVHMFGMKVVQNNCIEVNDEHIEINDDT